MTADQFHELRKREYWRSRHAVTHTGYYVAGMGKWENKRAGRITQIPDGRPLTPHQWAEWQLNGVAIDHDFGDLDMSTVNG